LVFDRVLAPLPEVASALDRLNSAAWAAVDPELLDVCRLRVAMLLGCETELALGSTATSSLTLEDVRSWTTSDRVSPRQRACLAFAEQFVIDVKNLDDNTVSDVTEQLGVEGLVNFVSALLVIEQRQRLQLTWNALFTEKEAR
jgi:alkylhydroperoxidase family enzyme